MVNKISDWVQKRIEQISSLSEYAAGGKDKKNIDSNEEFACLGRLLANCNTDEDKKFISDKMQTYLLNSKREHFEKDDGTSFDEVFDETGNRMYVGYDKQGNIANIETTEKNDQGVEVPKNKENPITFDYNT